MSEIGMHLVEKRVGRGGLCRERFRKGTRQIRRAEDIHLDIGRFEPVSRPQEVQIVVNTQLLEQRKQDVALLKGLITDVEVKALAPDTRHEAARLMIAFQ